MSRVPAKLTFPNGKVKHVTVSQYTIVSLFFLVFVLFMLQTFLTVALVVKVFQELGLWWGLFSAFVGYGFLRRSVKINGK